MAGVLKRGVREAVIGIHGGSAKARREATQIQILQSEPKRY